MRVLAIDSSARRRLVAVLTTAQGRLLAAEVAEDVATIPALQRALARLLRPDLMAVVVVTGPGSYMGLRAGLAAGLGLAHALDLPLHGVGSLEVVACAGPGDLTELLAVADAGRGGAYAAPFHRVDGRLVGLSRPTRVGMASLQQQARIVVSLDALEVAGLHRGEPTAALAAAVPVGLGRPALPRAGLGAAYADETAGPPAGPQVSSS